MLIVDKNGEGNYSSVVRVEIASHNQVTMQLYPNPSSGIFVLDVSGLSGSTAQAVITNAVGQVVQRLQISTGRTQIDARLLSAGVYTVSLTGSDNRQVQQIVIATH